MNELPHQGGGGLLRFRGSVDEPGTNLTVGGNTVTVDTNRNFHFNGHDFGSLQNAAQGSGLRTRYDYDPWGRRVNVNGGDVEGDFGFTGHYYHGRSGLHLALYRAYNAELGRWLSRDVAANFGNVNFYEYVDDDPTMEVDLLGLWGTGGQVNPKKNTVVCDGKGGIRVQLGDNAPSTSPCVLDCITQHEMSHASDALKANPDICKGKADGTEVLFTSKAEQEASEIKATNAELACLSKLLAGCPKDCSLDQVKHRIKRETDYRDSFK